MEKKTLYLIYVIIVLTFCPLHAETQKTILQYPPYAVTYMITYIQSNNK